MKYRLHFLYTDMAVVEVLADRFHIQSDMLILEEKEAYEGQVLRTDEKYKVFMGVNLRDVKRFDVEEV